MTRGLGVYVAVISWIYLVDSDYCRTQSRLDREIVYKQSCGHQRLISRATIYTYIKINTIFLNKFLASSHTGGGGVVIARNASLKGSGKYARSMAGCGFDIVWRFDKNKSRNTKMVLVADHSRSLGIKKYCLLLRTYECI
jgi:hypothetical protein